MIRICQTPNESIEIDNSKHDSTGFATKITSISHQPPSGSANAQFDKTQFFLDTLQQCKTFSEVFSVSFILRRDEGGDNGDNGDNYDYDYDDIDKNDNNHDDQ